MPATLITIDDGSQWLVSLDYTTTGQLGITIGRSAPSGQHPTAEQVVAIMAATQACAESLRNE